MKKIFAVIAIAAGLAGCQSAPPINFSVPNVGYSTKKIDAELKSMTVGIARADEKTGELPAGMEVLIPQLWQTSLQESLNKMAVFNDDASTKINLSVKILKLDIPSGGINFTTETAARYEILDRKTGAIIYTQDISSTGEVPFDYAFAGATRQREAINRSVRNNITQFLQALQTVDVSKPMFPVKVSQK
jgi:type IV pilus biogenesis protein CpaD/CtpE